MVHQPKPKSRLTSALIPVAALAAFLLLQSFTQEKNPPSESALVAEEAYIYGYPLITMDMTRMVSTNVSTPEGTQAPMGQFANLRHYPDASFKTVTAPNADTLYSVAWLDLSQEPYVLSLPDEQDRYFLMPMLSGWTDVFEVPGKRTTGTNVQNYTITGPHWKGPIAPGTKELKSPTNMVWILGRTYCDGTPEDYQAVHALQDKYALIPLSSYGKSYTPPKGKIDPTIDTKTAVREQVNNMAPEVYFNKLAALMQDNPPAAADAEIVKKMKTIGIIPGQKFDLGGLDPKVAEAVKNAPKAALEKIAAQEKSAGEIVNGWTFSTQTGVYGTNYIQRAFVTAVGLGANKPQDAIYPMSKVDSKGEPYSGANKYKIRFAQGQTPPVKGFWSLTMYNEEMFFVDNPINRYSVSPRNNLKSNPDGSIDLYIQNTSPGKDKESNWLPAPEGKFVLMFRFYWPEDTLINGDWKPPAVEKI